VTYTLCCRWWLIKEAKKRNPAIPLMALSWGMPGWVGGGQTLSQGGADYHVNYLLGAKKLHNISFDWIGIWNEAPWSSNYILTLRHSLDKAGLKDVQITAADGGTDVIVAAAKNKTLADAIGSFGIHTHVLAPDQDINNWDGAKGYFNTENDLVDGALPQWGPTMRASLNWPLAFINNYLLANGPSMCTAIVFRAMFSTVLFETDPEDFVNGRRHGNDALPSVSRLVYEPRPPQPRSCLLQ
jgi:hypothetical protein